MKTNEAVFDGLRMLSRNRLMVKLTVCVMLTGIVMEGMYELLGQYFQLKLGYNTADQVSRGSPCMNLIWLPWYCVRLTCQHALLAWLSHTSIVMRGLQRTVDTYVDVP